MAKVLPGVRREVRVARRDRDGFLLITIPAVLASGAHKKGEEAELIAYLIARALDVEGSGRVEKVDIQRELRHAYPGGKLNRIFDRPGGARYWENEPSRLRLRGTLSIVESFDCEVLPATDTRTFSMRWLDNRPRRNAAIFAAIVATGGPRSELFIQRFSKVDGKTRARWQKDAVISTEILTQLPAEWGSRMTHRRQLPNSWNSEASTGRASFKLRQAIRSRSMGEGPGGPQGTRRLTRRYYADELELVRALERRRAAGADVLQELAMLGTVFAGERGARRAYSAAQALCLAWPAADILPPHYRDDLTEDRTVAEQRELDSEERLLDTRPLKACPGGCGQAIPATQGRCFECAATSAGAWGAARRRRRR